MRAKDKEQTIERALRGLRAQTVEMEIILVDSGSTDRTVELARPYCDQVITIPAEAFTYGRALNLGAEHASGEVVFALVGPLRATEPSMGRGLAWGVRRQAMWPGRGGPDPPGRCPADRAGHLRPRRSGDRRDMGFFQPRLVLAQDGLGAVPFRRATRRLRRQGMDVACPGAGAQRLWR